MAVTSSAAAIIGYIKFHFSEMCHCCYQTLMQLLRAGVQFRVLALNSYVYVLTRVDLR